MPQDQRVLSQIRHVSIALPSSCTVHFATPTWTDRITWRARRRQETLSWVNLRRFRSPASAYDLRRNVAAFQLKFHLVVKTRVVIGDGGGEITEKNITELNRINQLIFMTFSCVLYGISRGRWPYMLARRTTASDFGILQKSQYDNGANCGLSTMPDAIYIFGRLV